jgi:hypothetical protein
LKPGTTTVSACSSASRPKGATTSKPVVVATGPEVGIRAPDHLRGDREVEGDHALEGEGDDAMHGRIFVHIGASANCNLPPAAR